MRPTAIFLLTALLLATLGQAAQEQVVSADGTDDSKSTNAECQDIRVKGQFAQGAELAKQANVVELMAKTREPSLFESMWHMAVKEGDMSSPAFMDILVAYGRTFLIYAGIPAVLLVLVIVLFPTCVCCRMCSWCAGDCRHKCCGRFFCCTPKGTYGKGSRLCAFLCYFFFGLVALVCVVVGLVGGNTFATGFLKATCHFDGTRVVAENLLNQLIAPADDLASKIDGIVDNVNVSMVRAHGKRYSVYAHEGLDTYTAALNALETYAKNVPRTNITGANPTICQTQINPYCNSSYDCVICEDPSAIKDVAQALDDNLKSPSVKLQSETQAILDNLVGAATIIKDAVKGVKSSLGTVTSFLGKGGQWDNAAQTGIEYTAIAKKNASYASGVPFGLVGFGGVLTLIGVFMMTTMPGRKEGDHAMKLGCKGKLGSCCVSCGWFWTCISMFVLSLLCLVLWPLMFVSVDVCGVLEKLPDNVTKYAPLPPGPGQMLQFCFRSDPNKNISFIPDDMVNGFDFSQSVSFNSAKLKSNIDELFDKLPMDKLRHIINNNMTNFTSAQLQWGTADQQARARAIMKIKGMMTNITRYEQSFKRQMKISIDNIDEIQNITKPMFSFADSLKQDFSCKAVGKEFEGTVNILCGDILSGMSLFVGALLATAIVSGPLVFGGLCINRAYGGHGLPPKPKDGEEEQIVELAGQWEHPSNAYNVKSWDNIGTNKRA